MSEGLPNCLLNLLKPDYMKYTYEDLLQLARQCDISVTPEQIQAAERATRSQYKFSLWFTMRTGRITASLFKRACRTNVASPSISLIMAICHPESTKFTNSATRWGCEHEQVALAQYQAISASTHEEFKVGMFCNDYLITCLLLDRKLWFVYYPFIGASPDSVVSCLCCGEGVCEVKVR